MKNLKEYVKIFEAPKEIKIVIGGLYKFNKNTSNEEIIESILRDFSLKCATLIKEYSSPESGLSSLTTYDIFMNRWGIQNPGDVTSDDNAENIYSNIPTELCSKYISEVDGIDMSEDNIRKMFDSGEFPAINIYKGYHQGRDEIHVTYTIGR